MRWTGVDRRWAAGGCASLLWAGMAFGQPDTQEQARPDDVPVPGVTGGQARPERGVDRSTSHVLARRLEHAAERAAAFRLSREVSGLLGPDGLPAVLGDEPLRNALRGIATRCELLALSSTEPEALRDLYASQARVYNALVQDAAAHGESVEVARGLGRLRAAARQLAEVQAPGAEAVAAYWQMLADLIDANRTIESTDERRVFVRELLSRYVATFGGEDRHAAGEAVGLDASAAGYVLDARVGLARLMDEAGEQAAAAEALGPLREAEPGDERYEQAREVLERSALIGQAPALDLPLVVGGRWRLADHVGTPVLLHIYAGDAAGADTAAGLRRAVAATGRGGFAVVSLHVGEVPADASLPPWPTAVVAGEDRAALASLGVDAVPMYVWIDHAGRVAAIGRTLAVLDRQPAPAPKPDPTEGDEAEGGLDAQPNPPAAEPGGP